MFLNKNLLFYNYYKNILIQYWFRKYVYKNKLKLPIIYKITKNISFNNINELNIDFFNNFFKIWLVYYNLFLIYPIIKNIKNNFIINNSTKIKTRKKIYNININIYIYNKFLLYNYFNNILLLFLIKIISKNNLLKLKIFNLKNYSKISIYSNYIDLYNGYNINENIINNCNYISDIFIKKCSKISNIQKININFIKDLCLIFYK